MAASPTHFDKVRSDMPQWGACNASSPFDELLTWLDGNIGNIFRPSHPPLQSTIQPCETKDYAIEHGFTSGVVRPHSAKLCF